MTVTKRKVFYSFHFDLDVFRVQQVRNMGIIEGNEPVTPNGWEQLQKTDGAVARWIDNTMAGKSCVVVLIGAQTSRRPWVRYEIEKAWNDGKALLGVHIHNLKCPRSGIGTKGKNPFEEVTLRGANSYTMPKTYDPRADDAYGVIKSDLSRWVEAAITQRS